METNTKKAQEGISNKNQITLCDDFNDGSAIKLIRGKRIEVIMIDAYGEEKAYFYLDGKMANKIKDWL